MTGRRITIPFDDGLDETLRVLCCFDYDLNHYFIAIDPVDDEFVCRRLKWSIFKGTYQCDECVPKKILLIAKKLLREADENSFYKMNGEHYKVKEIEQDGISDYEFELKSPYSKYFTYFMMHCSETISFISAIIIASIYAYIYIEITGMMWITTIFTNVARNPLRIFMYAFEITGSIILFKLRDSDERGIVDLYFNALIPLNLITLMGLVKVNIVARVIILSLFALFCVIKGIPIIHIILSKGSYKVKKRKIYSVLDGMYTPVMICVVCGICAVNIFGITGYTNISTTKTAYNESETIMTHYKEALQNISESEWEKLTAQQKIDTLQSICDYECAETLGCKTATVQAGYTQKETVLGEYSNITNTILVNVEYMNGASVDDVINTLLHEVRHIYQYAMIEMLNDVEGHLDEEYLRLYAFQYASDMRNNFDNYQNGTGDYDKYYEQVSEEDSRLWAERELENRYEKYIYTDYPTEEDS